MDNSSTHKGDQVKETLKELGYIPLYTPPYSPWFNPIEKCFSMVKKNFSECQNIDKSFDLLEPETHFKPYFRHVLSCDGMNLEDASINRNGVQEFIPFQYDENDAVKRPAKKKKKMVVDETTETKVLKGKNEHGETVSIKTTTITRTTTTPKKEITINNHTAERKKRIQGEPAHT